jgi:hypothetical protein
MENLFAVFAVDPGGNTGLAWGVFHKEAETVKEAIEGRFCTGQLTISGYDANQVTEICRIWRRLYKEWVYSLGIDPRDCHMVIEDFVLGPKTPSGKDPLRAINIGQGVKYYRMGSAHEHERWNCGPVPPTVCWFQTPGQASSFAKKERLVDWGVWIRGKQHERSAWRHVALRVALLMESRRLLARTRARA